ncbi:MULTISPECIES: dipeptide ABC transporter ATP-binding protein [Pantoea]|uniref:ABC-type dipeptide transporter n=1 Tax=Candidatus Pantoea floridensis TaxID=1938870 RepID=A0A286BZB2_9GAMM|nr:dipeptide ABC transporter ATP-binding protein [Pantoea floridensis]PIF21982.1 peptide/nickel transport system ATP-binding protein/microcin C transport system ATP-binding protein [Enterobacteriaceae bacterium JKS000233]SOD39492.1 peptide/nickel transport system ATP-binding protein/microcin C transport system ATP-binding protein [Pantoea floridensis]
MNLLTVSQLKVQFGDQVAVKEVSLTLAPGEVLALAGESGSGKSLTAAAILGLLPATAQASGAIHFSGRSLLNQPESLLNRLRGHDIAMVFQNSLSTLDPSWRVGKQLQHNLRRLNPSLRGAALRAEALRWLERMHIREAQHVFDLFPHELSGGMRQRVLIALAVMCQPSLLIADEPTTALDASVQFEVLSLLRELRGQHNMAMLLITHDFGVVAALADRVAVMRQGVIVETGVTRDIIARPQHPYTQTLLAAVPRPDLQPVSPSDSAILLQASGIGRDYWRRQPARWWPQKSAFSAVDAVDVQIGQGEVVGVIGESGSGKSTLLRLLAQLIAPTRGSVRFAGQPLTLADADAQRAFRRQVQCVFQDSLASFNPRLTLREQLIRPQLRLSSASNRTEALLRAQQVFSEVGLNPALLARYPHQLSGGQRQRANIARALVVNPSCLLLDEPTSALDLSIQAQVMRLLTQLHQQRQLSCLFVSHNLALVTQFCQRIVVMEGGKVVDDFPRHALYAPQRHAVTQRLLAANLLPDAVIDRDRQRA